VIVALNVLGLVFLAGAVAVFATGEPHVAVGVVLLLLAMAISFMLAIRRGFLMVRGLVTDVRAIVSSRSQTARIVDVGNPKGIFAPRVNVVLELEGETGAANRIRIDRDFPIPFPVAWAYRLGKLVNLPGARKANLAELLALELKREGLRVSASRPAG